MTRDEIIRNLEYTMEKHKNDTVDTFETNISIMCKDILDYLKQESKIGHWIKSNIGGAKVCSECQAHMGLSNFKYCPNCGKKMEEGE